MDRNKWGEIVGDNVTVEDDLRWTLFQAERSIETMYREEAEKGRLPDIPVLKHNLQRRRDCHTALAALWQHNQEG